MKFTEEPQIVSRPFFRERAELGHGKRGLKREDGKVEIKLTIRSTDGNDEKQFRLFHFI
jgi:hypothetical protein